MGENWGEPDRNVHSGGGHVVQQRGFGIRILPATLETIQGVGQSRRDLLLSAEVLGTILGSKATVSSA